VNTLDLLGASESRPITRWLPRTGGLLAAGIIAFVVCRPPLLHTLSWSEIVSAAVASVLAVFVTSAVTVWVLNAIKIGTSAFDRRRLALRASADALWLAPLALFIRENSAWTIAMAAVLVATATKSFCQDRPERAQTEESPDLFLPNPFSQSESSPWFWRQFGAAAAALCGQTGALAGLAGYPLTAATLVGVSAAVWTSSFMRDAAPDGAQFSTAPQSTRRTLLVLAMATIFTVGALIRYLPTQQFGRFVVSSHHHAQRFLAQVDPRPQSDGEKASQLGERHGQPGLKASGEAEGSEQPLGKTSEGSFASASDANSGVILWSKEQTYTKLITPAPAMGNGLLKSSRSAKPLTIPFNGVYWFFKAPDLHPPSTSRQAHGSPELLDIHSTDRHPLSMEAHEHFGSMIDLDCCGRIQIAIRNADVYSETVSLELVLINSSLPGKPSQSLGTITVKSTPSWKIYEKPSPAGETLNFPIPTNPSLRRFDEVMIVFRLAAFRADDGAKIAIDHFVLVPRGL